MAYAPPSTRRTRSAADSVSRAIGRPSSATKRGAGRPALEPPSRGRGTFVAGVLVGLAVGAAAALLLAPHSGAETRQALRQRSRRVRNKASDAWEDLRLELTKTARALRRKRRDARSAAEAEPRGTE
jgi:hypothetical protein